MSSRELKVLILGEVPEIGQMFERPMFTKELPAAGIWVSDEDFVPALEATDNYDLIVVDLEPHGLEILEEVRRHRPTNPVLAVAGADKIDTLVEAKRRGLEDYVVRTGNPSRTTDLLAETIRTLLERFVEPPEMDRPSADLMYRYAHFYNVAEPFFLVSVRRHLIYINNAGRQLIERLHGHTPTIGEEVEAWSTEPTLEEFHAHLDRAFEGHEVVTRRELPSESGADELHELLYQPVVDPAGRVIAVSIAVHEPGRPQLQRARTAQEVTKFAGGIAHRLNNLLNVITTNAELLNEHGEESEPVERIYDGAERAAELIRKMQAYSRIAVTDREELSIDEVVGEIEEDLRRSVGPEVQIQLELGDQLPTVHLDRDQLEMVVDELVTNAAEASEPGDVVCVRAGSRQIRDWDPEVGIGDGAYVVLELEDQGEGIAEDVREQSLEPFFTTRSTDEHAGLGLAIVRTVAEQAGGGIAVESTLGEGTTVRVYFPVRRDRLDSDGVQETGERESPNGDVTVLLVEDELTLQQSYRDILELDGYQVLTASTVEEAEAIARSDGDRIDLIVTDIVLPDGRGTDLAGDLLEEIGVVPVLFVSGYTEEPDEIDRGGDAPSAFLAKPFGIDTLLETVDDLLTR